MNAAETARLRFQSLVAQGLSSSAVAARVGLAAASEVWGGGEPRDLPAWYVWLRGVPGAWQLELAGAEPVAAARPAVAARFTVRRYPSPGDPLLAAFSPEERRVAAAALDATGAPRIEDAAGISPAHFAIATLEWAFEVDGDVAAVALSSLDRLRARAEDGAVVRDVPGWRLGAAALALVAGLDAQVERRSATRLVLSRQPGFEVVLSGGRAEHRDAPDAVLGEAVVALSRPGAAPVAASALVDALRDPDGEVVADVPLAPHARSPRELGADPRLPVSPSHAWFGGAAHAHDLVACAC